MINQIENMFIEQRNALRNSVENAKKFVTLFESANDGTLPKPKFYLEEGRVVVAYWDLDESAFIKVSFDGLNTFTVFKIRLGGRERYEDCVSFDVITFDWFKELLS